MSQKKQSKDKLKSRTYILKRTWAFFIGRSGKPNSGAACFDPCSGAARRGPAVSGAAPLRPVASMAAAFSLVRLGLSLRPQRRLEADLAPLATRDT
jgi:hypothetical protein